MRPLDRDFSEFRARVAAQGA